MSHATVTARYEQISGLVHTHTLAGEPVAWRLHTPARDGRYGVPGVIVGGPGAGKTHLTRLILDAAGRAPIQRWVGTAIPGGYPGVGYDWLSGAPREAGWVVTAAAEMVDRRFRRPDQRWPLLVVVIDTTDSVLSSSRLIDQATRLVTDGPRVGISPVLLADTGQLSISFGCYRRLRDAACAHQVVNLSTDPLDRHLLPSRPPA